MPQPVSRITGLKPGSFAIKAFHDVDGDGKMVTNPFGMPIEPFAFSNNAARGDASVQPAGGVSRLARGRLLDPIAYLADRQSAMLSQKTRYAIRAMQHLADHHGEGPVQLATIAEAQNIPAKFLTVILSELTRFGLVASHRGRDGGYWLAIPPVDITYGDLVRHMRGSLALVPCASRYAHEKCKNCVEEGECRTRALMLDVRDRTAEILDGLRLSDSIEPVPPFTDEGT